MLSKIVPSTTQMAQITSGRVIGPRSKAVGEFDQRAGQAGEVEDAPEDRAAPPMMRCALRSPPRRAATSTISRTLHMRPRDSAKANVA